jgi:hypothetical protein
MLIGMEPLPLTVLTVFYLNAAGRSGMIEA